MESQLFLIAKLKSLITNSTLNKEDKDLWFRLIFENINNLNPDTLILLLNLIQSNSDTLFVLTNILKEKSKFLKSGDVNNLKKIINLENELINTI